MTDEKRDEEINAVADKIAVETKRLWQRYRGIILHAGLNDDQVTGYLLAVCQVDHRIRLSWVPFDRLIEIISRLVKADEERKKEFGG
jgi:hypothetical protein